MKIKCMICGLCLLLLGLAGCDNYAQKEIHYEATPNVPSLSLFVNETFQLRANPLNLDFTWSSSDESVATVSSDGFVTAVGRGTSDITARAGDIYCTVPLTAIVRIPLTDFVLNMTWMELAVGGIQEVKIIPIPTDANDMGYATWTSDDEDVATVSYAGTVKCLALGETTVTCNINGITRSISVKVSDVLPFNGPHVLYNDPKRPLIITAADFDYGGVNKGWWWNNDSRNGNLGNYRSDRGDPNCDVSIESGESLYGSNIGWTGNNKWLQYSVDVMEDGDYLFDVYVAVNGNCNGYAVEVNGELISANNIPFISWGSGYQNYRWYHSWTGNPAPTVLSLTEGRQRVKFHFRDGNFNFSAIRFTAVEE